MTSTINPTVPATDSDLTSAPIRTNFLAAYNDVNALQASVAAVIPSQTGQSGKFLSTDGTNTSWGTVSGAGTVTTTGSPASGNLTKFSGATSIVNGDLSGDVTTSGALVTAVAKIAGVAVGTPTGTTNVVFSNSPTLVSPTLGAALATSINKVAITAPASSATLTIANTKTLTANNSLTLAGVDSTTITFQGTDTYVGRATTDTLTNKTLNGATIDSSIIGANTPAAATVTTLAVNSSSTFNDMINVTSGGINAASTVTIAGGKIQPTGSSAPANGMYLPATNTVGIAANNSLVASFTSTGLNNTIIGATTSAAATFTTVTLGTALSIANGGTGQTTANAAFNALAPSQSTNSGKVLTTDGTNTSWVSSGGSILPAQGGQSGKYLTTDGTNASWGALAGGGTVTTSGSPVTGNLAKFSSSSAITNGDLSGDVTTSGTLAATVTHIGGVAVGTPSGTGNVVFSTSPTLVTPVLGTPTSVTLTNATGLPISTGVTGLGTGVGAFLVTPSSANLATAVTGATGSGALVFATSPTLVTPIIGVATGTSLSLSGLTISSAVATDGSKNLVSVTNTGTGNNVLAISPTLVTPLLGTPTSGVLTNCTGYPVANIAGAGTGVLTFLATPSSANLATALTDGTGTGANVFANGPTLIAPLLGTPASGVATNLTGLPLTSGVTGILAGTNGGTGVANTGKTITLGGNLATSGAFATTLTVTNTTGVTLPTTGTLATLAGLEVLTNKTINGASNTITNVSLTSGVTGILPVANGGTNNAFFTISGPASSAKTYTVPNASCNILTDNAVVTGAQGGTGNGFFAVSGPSSSLKTFTFPNASANVLTDNATVTVLQGGTGTTTSTGTGNVVLSSAPTIDSLTVTTILANSGGIVRHGRVVTAAGAVTITSADDVVIVNKTVGAATTVNLNATPTTWQTYTIKDGKGDCAANNITIVPNSGNIDGAANFVISINYGSATIIYNGSSWSVI